MSYLFEACVVDFRYGRLGHGYLGTGEEATSNSVGATSGYKSQGVHDVKAFFDSLKTMSSSG